MERGPNSQPESAHVEIETDVVEEFLPHMEPDTVLTPSEVGDLLGVGPKTVSRWAEAGKLRSFRTLGMHRRFYFGDVEEAVRQANEEDQI